MEGKEMPIFTKTFDLLSWLLPATNHFPRAHRLTFSKRLLDAAFEMRERLEEANMRRGKERMQRLDLADEQLCKTRLYLRLAAKWNWLSGAQYRHVSEMTVEVGKLLGGWKKATEKSI